MMMNDDLALLREFATSQSGRAFETLVARHIHLVHSAALRQVRDPHLAEEITQAVFIILARKADKLPQHAVLSGWLYRTVQYASADALKTQRRRRRREQEAYMQSMLENSQTETTWRELAPLLDEAMTRLGQTDRDAVVLRFFENKNLAEVGGALGLQERAAQKRIARALEKLRIFFAKRGVALSAAAIAGAVSANSVQAAPVALTKTISAVAITKGAAASGSTITIIKGALKLMAWTKMKIAVAVGAAIILAAGTTTTMVVRQQHPQLPEPQPVAAGQTEFPKESWVFAGYADPPSALLSSLWAQTKSDSKTFLASLTPESQQKQQQMINDLMRRTGKSREEAFYVVAGRMNKTKGFQIRGQEIVSDHEVLLHMYVDGNDIALDARIMRVGNEWKIDDYLNPKALAPNKHP